MVKPLKASEVEEWVVEFHDTRNFYDGWMAAEFFPNERTLESAMKFAKEQEDGWNGVAPLSYTRRAHMGSRIHLRVRNIKTGDILPAAIL